KQFRNYTVKDGLISNDISLRACLRQRDGSLWFGTAEGAVRYRAVKHNALALPPRLYLGAIKVKDLSFSPKDQLSLSYDRNSITFEFLGLSFLDEEAIRYSYMLEGLDNEWSE